MPIIVFGSTSHVEEEHDASSFFRKPILTTLYTESNTEEYNGMKNELKRKLTNPVNSHETASKTYISIKFDDPSKTRNPAHVAFKDKNANNVHFVKVNSLPLIESIIHQRYIY